MELGPPIDFARAEYSVVTALDGVQREIRRERRTLWIDPLDELVGALQHGERLSLAWVVKWDALGRASGLDALAAAWMHSGSHTAMAWILRRTDREYLARRVEAAAQQTKPGEVSRAVPANTLPSLVELLSAPLGS